MSGFSRFYVFGGAGGFMGADGVDPVAFMIFVGDGDRQWLEPPSSGMWGRDSASCRGLGRRRRPLRSR